MITIEVVVGGGVVLECIILKGVSNMKYVNKVFMISDCINKKLKIDKLYKFRIHDRAFIFN